MLLDIWGKVSLVIVWLCLSESQFSWDARQAQSSSMLEDKDEYYLKC